MNKMNRGGILVILEWNWKYILKRSGIVILAVTVFWVSTLFGDERPKPVVSTAVLESSPTIIIDPGHGGFDGGAVSEDGTLEKDINLDIAFFVEKLLKFYGYRVTMTRNEDTGTESVTGTISGRKKSDLENRLLLMSQNPDSVYVSIHLNKYTTSAAAGAQIFYTPNIESAPVLADCIQATIRRQLQPENNRKVKSGGKSAYLLMKATVPAVIVECGFLSNHRELELLKDRNYQAKMAFSIVSGILDFSSKNSGNT